jgi:deoxyribodipyrimidine photo-lyase
VPRVARDGEIAGAILRRWKSAREVTDIPIDHRVPAVAYAGGARAAGAALDTFIAHRLERYDQRDHPDAEVTSDLSPYLHFGHISAHEIAARVWSSAGWDLSRLVGAKVTGSRAGWWGLPATSEAFLDQLVTWRELGYVFCHHRRDYAAWSALPAWARATLDKHARDPRRERYTRRQLETGRTRDPIWNAAQRQLLIDGRIHNYLRMLWGKRILEWSSTPRAALATMIELNNKYGVDGRDPNSYSGILWTLGLFDRAWGPERSIFGIVRYMSSEAARRKLRMREYLRRWS